MRGICRTSGRLAGVYGSPVVDGNVLGARRILVYGVTGSGKSAAAARISAVSGIAWTSVDDLTWEPGWVLVPEEEQRRRIERICAGEAWLLDTAYGAWLDVPLGRVELIIALDYPRWFSLQRLARRTLARILDKRPVCNQNTETWRSALSRDSIIAWHFRSFRSKRSRIEQWALRSAEGEPGPRVLRFTRSRDLEAYIGSIGD